MWIFKVPKQTLEGPSIEIHYQLYLIWGFIGPLQWRHNGGMASQITVASQITSLTIVYSGIDQRKHKCSAWLVFARGIHRWPVNYPHKGPVTRKMFSFDDVIMPWRKNAQVPGFSSTPSFDRDPWLDMFQKTTTNLSFRWTILCLSNVNLKNRNMNVTLVYFSWPCHRLRW